MASWHFLPSRKSVENVRLSQHHFFDQMGDEPAHELSKPCFRFNSFLLLHIYICKYLLVWVATWTNCKLVPRHMQKCKHLVLATFLMLRFSWLQQHSKDIPSPNPLLLFGQNTLLVTDNDPWASAMICISWCAINLLRGWQRRRHHVVQWWKCFQEGIVFIRK